MKENEKYLDSIQGRIDLFTNSVQTMWMNFIDSDAIKFLIDIGNLLVKAADKLGVVKTAIIGIVGYLTFFKKKDWIGLVKSLQEFRSFNKNGGIQLLEGDDLAKEIENLNAALKSGPEAFNAYKAAQKDTNNGMYQMIQTTDKAQYTTEDYTVALKDMAPAAQTAAQKQQLVNAAIGVGIMVVTSIVAAIQEYVNNIKTLQEEYDDLQSSISSLENEISSLDSQLNSTQEQIDALSNKKLSFTEAEELRRLKEQSTELQRQKELQENILAARNKQNEAKSLAMINNLLKTTAANQERAAESGALWGKILGGIVGAAAAIGGIALTVGSGGILTGAGVALAGAGAYAGTQIGGWAGKEIGSNSKATDGSLVEWYESYTKAIEEAEQEASAAEAKYLSDVTDKNYEKWQKKVDAVNTLQKEMYDSLEEMQEYISNLEYNDQTKEIIDNYNNLMTQISIKNNDGNIQAQISSIESLKSEYEKLSKGVDENGKNISLSAEEYAKYQSIIEQILGYTPSLIQGYNDEGKAIVNKNNLIERSIELLKEQQRLEAQKATNDENIISSYNAAQSNYESYIKSAKNTSIPTDIAYSGRKITEDGIKSGYVNQIDKYIADIIGIEKSAWESTTEYIVNNADAIYSNLGAIIERSGQDKDGWQGLNAQEQKSLLNFFNQLYVQLNYANGAMSQFKQTLYTAPQASTFYDQLSDSSQRFINEYISSLDGLENLSEDEVKQIRDNLALLPEKIAQSSEAQNLIENLFDVDPSIPAQKYVDTMKEILNQLVNQGIIDKDVGNNLVEQLVPSDDTINTLINQVSNKLQEEFKDKIGTLSLIDLKIAANLDIEEGTLLTWDQLLKKINEIKAATNTDIISSKIYSELSDSIEKFNEVQKQTAEIVTDNTEVTQDYKDSLTELGISETEVAKCFDETNPLIVKDAKALNNLVKSSRSNITQNVKLAKSQAILKYKDLYKQIKSLTSGQKISNQATLNQVNALYQEMGALQKTIVRYSMLEQQLLGATNAYEKFTKAQETDSATDYISSAEDMVLALGKAFNTAELGSETARASIAGLVPESVYQDLDTVDEKMAAIYDYFKNGKLSQYFTLEFDDDGAITSAEMKLGNLRKFIEDGLTDNNVFSGSDWQHFEFSDTFLAELDNLPEKADKLQYFADKMGVTKEVAFAFIKSLEDHDIEWLNGDYSSMFESLLPESLENDIYKNTTALAELEVQLANGKITAEDYNKALYGLEWQLNSGAISQEEYDSAVANLNQQLSEGKITTQQYTEAIKGLNGAQNENTQKARDNAIEWSEANTKVDAAKNKVETLTEALTKFKSSGAADQKIQIVTDELKKASNELSEALKKKYSLQEPTKVTLQLALDDIQAKMDQWKADNAELTVNVLPKLKQDDNGKWTIPADVVATLDETEKEQIDKYLGLLNDQYTVNVLADENPNDSTAELENVKTAAEAAQKAIEDISDPQIDTGAAISAINDLQTAINNIKGTSVDIYETTHKQTLYSFGIGGDQESNGTVHANGTAHASGNFGLPSSEHNALVGELGPEMVVNPYTGKYYTVGDNGAEMVDLPKGAIIFNHKQTEDLLNNGYVTSRGKMLANGSAHTKGNAHVTIWPNGSSKQQWTGTGYSSWNDPTYDAADALNNAADNLSDATDDFEEVFDWVEVRLEEINETLDLLNAKLENAVGYSAQNSIIDQMLGVHDTKMSNLQAGLQEYANYASKLLAQIPAQYQEAAQNGAIAIEEFAGEADEVTLDAIKNYREWAQKVADLTQQIEELRTEIADLAKQKFDNVSNQYDNIISLIENANEKLDAQVSLMEDRGYVAAKQYYESMVVNTKQQSAELANEKKALQAVLDQQVKLNNIKVGSDAWYEMVNALYEVDAAIVECTSDLEKYQNAINDIYWDNFDQLINRLDYLNNETQGLIDLMDNADMVSKPDNKNGWGAKDVEWTKEGIASLGLYAQQMEIAEYQAKQYAKAIDDLNKDYADGKYSENEYLDKLDELTSAQYDSIESYYDAQDAIKSLNETRVDAIKDGIEKEISVYEELISKKKEELDAEKDLYDFQKSTAEQQKSIADIQRKLSALSGDNSASSIAKRKKLEAELAQAKTDLEESYYNRSVDNRSNALDKELEDFQDEKNAEIEKWESYLENIEQVVADSLGIVQANASGIYDTLNAKAQEYDLTLSDAIMTPWQNGALAISDYQTTFDTAMSSTWYQLENIKMKWQEIIDKMAEAAKTEVTRQQKENKSYTSATYTPPAPVAPSKPATTQKAITVGGQINAGSARIYATSSGTGGGKQYFASDPVYTVLQEKNGYILVRHHSVKSGYSGWFKKSDVKAYAKGSKEIDKDQLGILDELGPELQLVPDGNGRLSYIKRGTAIIPSDISENLMKLGQLNPQDVLDRNRPAITPSKSIVNNEINIDCSVGTMVNIEHCDQNTLPDVEKIVDKTFNKHMQDINNSLKRFTR